MTQLELFETERDDVTIGELDAAIESVAELRADYEAKKKISTEAHNTLELAKNHALSLLTSSGKSSYNVDGVGNASVVNKLKVQMPASPELKGEFFSWLTATEGQDAFNHYATVNYNALNSLYNLKFEEADKKDEFKIPGISDPESTVELRFTKR